MASGSSSVRRYVFIWFALLTALIVSLVLGAASTGPAVIALIFVIAALKAYLVVAYYMHLAIEPLYLKATMISATLAVICFFIGVYPDVALSWSVIPREPAPAHGHGEAHADGAAEIATLKEPDAARGKKVYDTYCAACHQADGKGMEGKLAANFVDDAERMAQSDEVLLKSIADGKTGKIGTMPPWAASLSEQQRVDALKYIRVTFGHQP
jgi:mono/diheme cytochrome c family protein/cytochrome c oxidase subunit IV